MITTADANKEARAEYLKGVKLYTLNELTDTLGVTYKTMLNYVNTGKVKAAKIGGQWRVSQANLDKFINGET